MLYQAELDLKKNKEEKQHDKKEPSKVRNHLTGSKGVEQQKSDKQSKRQGQGKFKNSKKGPKDPSNIYPKIKL